VLQVSLINDKKALVLHLLFDVNKPVVLSFYQEYGHIVSYQWSVEVN